MKLNEIKGSDSVKYPDIVEWLKNNGVGIRAFEIEHGKKIYILKDIEIKANTLTDGKLPFEFSRVDGDFKMPHNTKSLKGCPQTVGGNFKCYLSDLESIEGAPETVGGDFLCTGRNIKSLIGGPKKVGDGYYVHDTNITSLQGIPEEIIGNLSVRNTKISNFEHGPKMVGGYLDAQGCKNLTSLKGAPEEVKDEFKIEDTRVKSLKGAPKFVGSLNMRKTLIASLIDISDIFERIDGAILLDGPNIKTGGVGLLLIDGLKKVEFEKNEALNIIISYLGRGQNAAFDCQQELEEKKFFEFAKV